MGGTTFYDQARYVSQALELVTETVIPNTFDPNVVFNDLSLHAFHARRLEASVSPSMVSKGAAAATEGTENEGNTANMWIDPVEPPRMEGSELVIN